MKRGGTLNKENLLKSFFRLSVSSKKTPGFDISSEGLRFVEFGNGKTTQVEKFGFYEGRFISKDEINDENPLKSILGEINKKDVWSKVTATLPDEGVYIFRTTLKVKNIVEAKKIIQEKISELIPLPVSEVAFTCVFVDDYEHRLKNISKEKRDVVVTVIPKEVMRSYEKIYRGVGLNPTFILRAEAIGKAVIRNGDLSPHFIIEILSKKTTVSIISGGIVQSILVINVDSEFWKDKKKFHRVISGIEKQYIGWHAGKNDRGVIKNIILVGSVNDPAVLREKLAFALRVKVTLGNVWTNVCSFDEYIPPITFEESLAYAAAVGCAIK